MLYRFIIQPLFSHKTYWYQLTNVREQNKLVKCKTDTSLGQTTSDGPRALCCFSVVLLYLNSL